MNNRQMSIHKIDRCRICLQEGISLKVQWSRRWHLPKRPIPAILRSRRMLMDSLARLLIKKEFDDISVQEIADEAT